MHADEVDVAPELVRALLAEQFPVWAELPLTPVESAGTDHAIYRLGADLAVRLPRIPSAARQVAKEYAWVPRLAPYVPLEVSEPVGAGLPSVDYPFPWSVCRWLDGANATPDRIADPVAAAESLGAFVTALRAVDATRAPVPGSHNFGRGVPLAARDEYTRDAIARCGSLVDGPVVTAVWEEAVAVPAWDGPPTWLHGDLQSGNLLCRNGRLTGVIDWGGLAAADPACDLHVAWEMFAGKSRAAFRVAAGLDDAAWARGRGWALSIALLALPYYLETNASMVARARHVIAEVLADA